MVAVLVGKKEIKSAKGDLFTIAYLNYAEKETNGLACKDAFVNGHDIPDALVGESVNVELDFKGRVTEITAA